MDKNSLRKEMMENRKAMDKNLKALKDEIIRKKIFESTEYINSKIIFIYVNINDEINTIEIIKKLFADGKRVAVPKVFKNPKRMEALEIKYLDELVFKGDFGILEPLENAKNLSDSIDLVIVPGLAFEKSGNRLGYGGGFYDRFFELYPNSKKIALCYDYQIVTNTYSLEYDKKVDKIISEDRIINC